VNVDLSDWSPSQYWEARLADQRMVGLFVIENFDESKVQFDFDKREIIVSVAVVDKHETGVATTSRAFFLFLYSRMSCGSTCRPITVRCTR
jgi:hypothetical protein